jgi:hypothetical protein
LPQQLLQQDRLPQWLLPQSELPTSSLSIPAEPVTEDTFLEALTALERVLDENDRRAKQIRRRIAQVRRQRSKGAEYAEIVASQDGPLIVHLLTESSTALDTSGSQVRRAEADALYAEGLTMERIAEIFGVTRQRVSMLLRKRNER